MLSSCHQLNMSLVYNRYPAPQSTTAALSLGIGQLFSLIILLVNFELQRLNFDVSAWFLAILASLAVFSFSYAKNTTYHRTDYEKAGWLRRRGLDSEGSREHHFSKNIVMNNLVGRNFFAIHDVESEGDSDVSDVVDVVDDNEEKIVPNPNQISTGDANRVLDATDTVGDSDGTNESDADSKVESKARATEEGGMNAMGVIGSSSEGILRRSEQAGEPIGVLGEDRDEVYTLVQQCKLSYDSKLRSALC
jgi:hypothetical protein